MALKEVWLLPHRARTSVGQPYAPSLALRFGTAWNLHIEHGRHQPPVNLGGQVFGHDISHLTCCVDVLDVEVLELGHVRLRAEPSVARLCALPWSGRTG